MGKKILLVTSHPLSSTDAASLVGDFGGPGTEYLIAVPAKVTDTGNPSLLSSNAGTPSHGDPTLASVRGDFPGAQGGSAGNPAQIDYGQQSAVEAEAIAGSASDALRGLGATASGYSLSDKDVAAHMADAAVEQKVDEVVVMAGHTGLTHVLGADLAARIEHHLKAAGSPITTVRQHRHH
jgi:hypothetical protein